MKRLPGQGDDEQESRTLMLGVKRTLSVPTAHSTNRGSWGANTQQQSQKLSPQGFPGGGRSKIFPQKIEGSDEEDVDYVHFDPATMSWSGNAQPGRPTGLAQQMNSASELMGENRLATGFKKPQGRLAKKTESTEVTRTSSNITDTSGSANDPVEISDDSDEEISQTGGVMINVASPEIPESEFSTAGPISSPQMTQISEDSTHRQLQAELQRYAVPTSKSATSVATPQKRKLADLTPTELDDQVKYALFHLSRDQIDLNRPVVCLACFEEGHIEQSCHERICTHCGAENRHLSRNCPTYRRCLRCRERGHDQDSCESKLKNTTVGCDYCGSLQHLENICPLRFFPKSLSPVAGTHYKLWVSCSFCASKTHLVGDCPQIRLNPEKASLAGRWSLKSLDPDQITNLSLESGTRAREIEAVNRNMRPQGLTIKSRAQQARARRQDADSSDDEEPFVKPRVGQRDDGARSVAQISNSAKRIKKQREDLPDVTHGDSYPLRGRNEGYATASLGRRRSRSPTQRYTLRSTHNSQRDVPSLDRRTGRQRRSSPNLVDSYHPQYPSLSLRPANGRETDPTRSFALGGPRTQTGDSWRPPLPKEPPPKRDPSPPRNTMRNHPPTRQIPNQSKPDLASRISSGNQNASPVKFTFRRGQKRRNRKAQNNRIPPAAGTST